MGAGEEVEADGDNNKVDNPKFSKNFYNFDSVRLYQFLDAFQESDKVEIMWADAILILMISICTAFLGEGLTWLLVYRAEKYRFLKHDIERQTKKLEKKKEEKNLLDRTQKRKIEREEERLKSTNRDLMMVKMKSMFAIGFAFTSLPSMFNSIFDGKVVAKLPFTPITWLQGLSHRNLLGDDYTECSFIFLYILCTMSIRQNIQKALGFAPSRAASKQTSMWTPDASKYKW